MSKIQTAVAGLIVVSAMAVLLVAQHRSQSRLRAENAALLQQVAELKADNESLSNSAATAKRSMPDDQLGELLHLRSEVGMLRSETNDLEKLRLENSRLRSNAANAASATSGTVEDSQAQQQAALYSRMNDAKQSCLGLIMFADANQNRFPTNLDQVMPYLKKDALSGTNDFELLYQGSLASFTNPATTTSSIIVRERTARPTPTGGWMKVYGYADGHVEAHFEQNGDFDAWEKQHLPAATDSGSP